MSTATSDYARALDASWATATVLGPAKGGAVTFVGETGRYYRFAHGLKRKPEWAHVPGHRGSIQDWNEAEVLICALQAGAVAVHVGLGRPVKAW